jgi:SAM-dependent methyltransferase
LKHSKLLYFCHNWASQICDPLKAVRGLKGLLWYYSDYRAYRRLPGAEPMRLIDAYPALHDRHSAHELDAHYFYVNAWAMRRIMDNKPARHVDVGSQTVFVALLSAVVPVTYLDYRPLNAALPGLECAGGSITALPFEDNALESVSCLHVAEHIGLGRYGDPLDPLGTRKAAYELARVIAPGGNLYFAMPVGKERVCFNAHRIHSAETVRDYFAAMDLAQCSGVHDDGRFVQNVDLSEFRESHYACGMFHFRKPSG